ncbi:hypothetical protein B5C34_15235 [Pacificimonas flava]|uniref:SPOR domain-containing protein n=2 Tax=Pacificimonas TaxID=1960290 RepID=A0A219B0X4_9SPHN|nr:MULTISPECIES: SPOR domain-containing protein [Pacificimonas]MBZ6379685.1 SPOR domain-containing protein [Pacificimonas aurantium]OWV31854.1 hypothetical protein B5C34_15235 [Pacificimonas flava]
MADGVRDESEFEEEPGEGLPWLEPTELELDERGGLVSRRAVLIVAGSVVAIVAALFLFAALFGGDDIEVPDGEVPLVRAPEGPFKVEPKDRGGLVVSESERMTSAVASGEDLPSDVATDRLPEVAVPVVPPAGEDADAPPRDLLAEAEEDAARRDAAGGDAPRTPASDEGAASDSDTGEEPVSERSSGGGQTIQLGAFSSQSRARDVWETFTGRYSYLAPLSMVLQPVEVNGTTLYRLRATIPDGGAGADEICNRLKLAGEQCVVV